MRLSSILSSLQELLLTHTKGESYVRFSLYEGDALKTYFFFLTLSHVPIFASKSLLYCPLGVFLVVTTTVTTKRSQQSTVNVAHLSSTAAALKGLRMAKEYAPSHVMLCRDYRTILRTVVGFPWHVL